MSHYSRTQLSDSVLTRELETHVASERTTLAIVLADLAEFDARRLYRAAGYPSLIRYCIGRFHMSEQAAYKRVYAARAARRFPVIFTMVADGRLHLSAVVLLKPHLVEDNAESLLAATHRTRAEVEQLVAERFPRPDLPTRIEPLSAPCAAAVYEPRLSPGKVGDVLLVRADTLAPIPVPTVPADLLAAPSEARTPGTSELPVPTSEPPMPRGRVTPLAPGRFAVQFTIGESTYELLTAVQDLLGFEVRSDDLPQVFHRALASLRRQLEKRKFAATDRPRPGHAPRNPDSRCIPDAVKRAVWQRDHGRCTFVSHSGRRCEARKDVEFDHIEPWARGGRSSVGNLRLRCRAHNQLEAERAFSTRFIEGKRLDASRGRSG